ncbi:MAG: hypothetical protein ACK58T_21205, partial [Phycisphaerae bacterium]
PQNTSFQESLDPEFPDRNSPGEPEAVHPPVRLSESEAAFFRRAVSEVVSPDWFHTVLLDCSIGRRF